MLEPMLASLVDAPLDDPQLVYEPKYDGIRAIVEVAPGGPVRLWSRLGNEKTSQFPEITAALKKWSARLKDPVVLDGEIVALAPDGTPAGFQQLQGRIHLLEPGAAADGARTALISFDLLQLGAHSLRELPLTDRRAALERLFGRSATTVLRVSEQVRGDGRALYKRALESGWEGLIAKRADSRYRPGKRTPDWRKLKIVHEQEFVIGGWTEPRQTRSFFGALLIGVFDRAALVYSGHIGTGFNERELEKLMKLMKPIAIKGSPFSARIKTNERAHWVKPVLVAQVKFTEWTADGVLRHPVYLGLRDDKKAEQVKRERAVQGSTGSTGSTGSDVVEQLQALEDARKDGTIDLPGGVRVAVTNLHKVFWPKQKLTKGDLFRYYAQAAPLLLPAVEDRPIVMKRFPNGIAAPPFYQHRATDTPAYVRVEKVKAAEQRPQIIGGDLATLLYTVQLASISQDPWFSRVQTPAFADYVALDLDPNPGVPFARVLDVAKWIHEELDLLGATGVPKTSGSDGLHVYVRMPPKTSYEAGLIFCQIIATVVAQKHPKVATIERSVKARGKRVYVDFLQNILGKTLATAYSARASAYAGVSAPLTWKEIDDGVDREDFTIQTMPARVKTVGDVWKTLRTSKPADLARVSRYVKR
ncbi:MAG TPA: DNA ligase D [Vicinamibacterales bacterium]|jgi:bifunctional non-homologous end joining protein LigD|nr:DNA ligase D [Vicinamibacterales bacterium]